MKEIAYTLEELAEAFDLTPRTARHYILNVLPDHHKQGRGRLARYGKETYDCFALIRKARNEGLTTEQIARVLADLDQEEISRVADGLEELTIVPTQTSLNRPDGPARMASVSRRMAGRFRDQEFAASSPDLREDALFAAEAERSYRGDRRTRPDYEPEIMESRPPPRWQVLYSDDELQITHKGSASPEQRRKVRLAAELIKGILED